MEISYHPSPYGSHLKLGKHWIEMSDDDLERLLDVIRPAVSDNRLKIDPSQIKTLVMRQEKEAGNG